MITPTPDFVSTTLSNSAKVWQIWIDRGGTFTDCVGLTPDGQLRVVKLLSDNPSQYPDAPCEGIRRLLGLPLGEPLNLAIRQVAEVRMGTTVATNALLTHTGEPTALAITRGFADLPVIAEQHRPDLFALDIEKPAPLHAAVVEIEERVAADGTVLIAPDWDRVRRQLDELVARGFRALAVSLLHADRFPAHERRIRDVAFDVGFTQVSLGSECSALPKLVSRTDTAIVDAYLTPVLRRYVESFCRRAGLGDGASSTRITLRFMQSSGGLVDARHFTGKDAIYSGPAGGVIGMAYLARLAQAPKAIGWDMGGTSTDVSHVDFTDDATHCEAGGGFDHVDESLVAGVRVRAPALRIVTVAAGGGSILGHDLGRLTVGPASAGANPGPACYRRGGPLCVTDANLFLGRLQPDHFPQVFGPRGDQPLDTEVVARRFADLTQALNTNLTAERVAEGYLRVANENMAKPIKTLSIEQGRNIRDYALICFGGAGAQHACAVAQLLGITRVIVHPLASVLAAFGLGQAPVQRIVQQAIGTELDPTTLHAAREIATGLRDEASSRLRAEGIAMADMVFAVSLKLRYQGTDTAFGVACELAVATVESLSSALATIHRSRFGYVPTRAAVFVDAVVVEARNQIIDVKTRPATEVHRPPVRGDEQRRVYVGGEWRTVPLIRRETLSPGEKLCGPALIVEEYTTTVLEPGCVAVWDARGFLELRIQAAALPEVCVGPSADPVLLEVFHNRFMSIAEQMGASLRNTARSTNIKERLDFSCAVFDGRGDLVANAPHIPVHLGAMSEAVKAVVRARRNRFQPGDAVATNDPGEGGSHLPDITVITPVFAPTRRDEAPLFFVASRGHHADVGGILPGSMPPFSRRLTDEGVVFTTFTLAHGGVLREGEILAHLGQGPYPARSPLDNLADLRAQLAANETGARELARLIEEFGVATVSGYMAHIQSHAADAVRGLIASWPVEHADFIDHLDDGTPVRVAIRLDKVNRRAVIDFSGTGEQVPGNLNAPRAVTVAAVLYVLRVLLKRLIPLNSGCLTPIELIIPPGSLLDPEPGAAVSGGNVETSQRVVDVLLGAFGAAAASQGTMNNLTFGTPRYQYYETICGGAGATAWHQGADAVHTHMTNTRITDPEVLERRYPVRLWCFAVRRGSGGVGHHVGGNGVIREFEFLEPMSVALISERRACPPFGLGGGEPGHRGIAHWIRAATGRIIPLPGKFQLLVATGDRLRLETPGGGGFGPVNATM